MPRIDADRVPPVAESCQGFCTGLGAATPRSSTTWARELGVRAIDFNFADLTVDAMWQFHEEVLNRE
jgi:hypothetical protein